MSVKDDFLDAIGQCYSFDQLVKRIVLRFRVLQCNLCSLNLLNVYIHPRTLTRVDNLLGDKG